MAAADAGVELDVAVNNAAATGVPRVDLTPLELTDEAATAEVIDTNLHGPLRVIRAVLPVMPPQGHGRIVNVSPQLARPRLGGLAYGVYGATKAALHALTLSLAKELEPLGIRVVLVEGGVLAATSGFDASIERARQLIDDAGRRLLRRPLAATTAVPIRAARVQGPTSQPS